MKNLDPLKLYTDMLRIRFVEETISQECTVQDLQKSLRGVDFWPAWPPRASERNGGRPVLTLIAQ